MEITSGKELLEVIKSKQIVIYGTGYVARRFYGVLIQYGMKGNIESFVTTSGSGESIDGLPVIAAKELIKAENRMVCIATHEAIKNEIVNFLKKKDIDNYIWIYPFQYELLLGEPMEENISVCLKDIIKNCLDDYRIAIRYLAIDQYYKKNNFGYECYIKLMRLQCSNDTAVMRLKQFLKLIESWEDRGYIKGNPVTLLDNYDIIDGVHRFAVASYFGEKVIACNIYSSTKSYEDIHGEMVKLTRKYLLDKGIEREILEILDATNDRIENQYKCGQPEGYGI